MRVGAAGPGGPADGGGSRERRLAAGSMGGRRHAGDRSPQRRRDLARPGRVRTPRRFYQEETSGAARREDWKPRKKKKKTVGIYMLI